MPGFSTAHEVTTLAGRGVGMDVVRAEVAAMGGRIDLDSRPGRGTRITCNLPVSLAVAQVVLLTVGAARVAVASSLVEQVLQLKPEAVGRGLRASRDRLARDSRCRCTSWAACWSWPAARRSRSGTRRW